MADSTQAANAPIATGEQNGGQPSLTPQPTQEEILAGNDINEIRRLAYGEALKLDSSGKVQGAVPLAKDEDDIDVDLNDDTDSEFNPALDNPFGKKKPEPEAAAPEVKAEEKTDKGEDDDEQEEEDDAAEETDDGVKPKRARVRMNLEKLPEQEQAIIKLIGKKQIPYAQAYKEITGQDYAPAKTEVEDAEPEITPEPTEAVEKQQSKIKDLRAQRAQLIKDFKVDEANVITEQIEEETLTLAEMRAEARLVARSNESRYENQVQESGVRAATSYPDAGKPGSSLHAAITKDVDRLNKVNPSFFKDPEWPELLAAKHAMKLGIAPANAKQQEKEPVKPQKAISRTVAPEPSNGKAAAVQLTGMTEQQFKEWVESPSTSAAEIRAALRARSGVATMASGES